MSESCPCDDEEVTREEPGGTFPDECVCEEEETCFIEEPVLCPCTEDTPPQESLDLECFCPRDEHGLRAHEETCLFYRNEQIIFPGEQDSCECKPPMFIDGVCCVCSCPPVACRCMMSGREVFDEWRKNRDPGPMPAVLEASHPLMQRFQKTLRQFLEKENAMADEEIVNLKYELELSKKAYDSDLEEIYRQDHDTNSQRVLIQEYEATLAKKAAERKAEDDKVKEAQERHKKVKEKLEENVLREREATEEVEALTALCRQLEQWRTETESDLSVSQRMSDKMRREKKQLAEEKRQLDMVIYAFTNEIWKLESRIETFHKQLEIKNREMELATDRVTSYTTELEDLELDKRRLVMLWNSVLVNIKQRDKVYDTVREDYKTLQENYQTMLSSLEATKKVMLEEMNKGKEIEMTKDKLQYDITGAQKIFDIEDVKRVAMLEELERLTEAIEMAERDSELIRMENQEMMNTYKTTEKEVNRKAEQRLKLENEILNNLQHVLLNDKAVETMASGIKKIREMSRKQELALTTMENQHAKMMLDMEVQKSQAERNKVLLQECLAKVQEKEKEIDGMEEKYEQKALMLTRKQRDLDVMVKKYNALRDMFDLKSPQERRIEELERQIKALRDRTQNMQQEWLRLQGLVVKLTTQQHNLITDINLINKQIQICEQKAMRVQAEIDSVQAERGRVARTLRDLRGRLEVLERTRKDHAERNDNTNRLNHAITYEYTANLKDAEDEVFRLEDEMEDLDKKKRDLALELDKVQREAFVWQRKGIMAVELKKSISSAQAVDGELGHMKVEIHRMEVRRDQLRRTAEKMAEDVAHYVTKREAALDKARATAAVEKSLGISNSTSQSSYKHKLRLAKSDVSRVTKDLADAKKHLASLEQEQSRLEQEIEVMRGTNNQLEEQVATSIKECHEAETKKQWLLERLVRKQRLGTEYSRIAKKQDIKVRKADNVIEDDYLKARSLNDQLRHMLETLEREFPYMEDRWKIISNTLEIHTPTPGSPRSPPEPCPLAVREPPAKMYSVDVAERPLEDQVAPIAKETKEGLEESIDEVASWPDSTDA